MSTSTETSDALQTKDIAALMRQVGEDPDLPNLCVPVAGMQYYDYNEDDDLLGRLRPNCGDRLQLVRQPDNPHDANAVQLRWRNGQFQLGHLPRQCAERIARLIDGGEAVRAYALNSGTGQPWSVWAVLVATGLTATIN